MNAYELADELENKPLAYGDDIQTWLVDAVIMLRQQADRIAELEGEVGNLKHINKNWQLSETMAYNRIAELEKDLALKTRDRDVFRDFTLAYEKRIEELEKQSKLSNDNKVNLKAEK